MADEITIRPAHDWEEVRQGAVGAGKTFPSRTEGGPFFKERSIYAPTLPLENTLLLFHDGTIISQLQLYNRRVTINGCSTPVGAIGNVYTLPEYQGQGYGRQLLEYSREYIEERDYTFSILLTGANTRYFYRQAGWEDLPYQKHRLVFEGTPDSSPEQFGEFSRADHLARLNEIHRSTYGQTDGMIRRTRHYWNEWILNPDQEILGDTAQVLVYPEQGDISGYLVWDTDDETARCLEWGFDNSGDGEDREFLSACWDVLAAETNTDAVVWFPPVPEVLVAEYELDLEHEETVGTMVQLHNTPEISSFAGEAIDSTDDLVELLTASECYWSPLDAF